MIENLINEYILCAEALASVDYADRKSVRQFNAKTDRMRAIVKQIVATGPDAVKQFASLLDKETVADSAAVNLVMEADLAPGTLARCFAIAEKGLKEAKINGEIPEAMIREDWLKEWRAKKEK